MKKILAFIMVCVMALMSFVGCGEPGEPTSNSVKTEVVTEAPPVVETFEETAVFSNDEVAFIVTSGPYEDGFWGAQIDVRLENNTEQTLMFSLENVSINGYMVDVLFATELTGGCKENTAITIFSTDLEANKIDKITECKFELTIYDSENWEADYIADSIPCVLIFE